MMVSVIVLAAGNGSRFSSDIPKQYLTLGHQSVLEYSIQAFLAHSQIKDIIVAVVPEHAMFYEPILSRYQNVFPVIGGQTRSDSVKNALQVLEEKGGEKVLIHDAARPFLRFAVIDRVLSALKENTAVVPALPSVDTIKVGGMYVEKTLNRSLLKRIQTPQGFCVKTLMQCYVDNCDLTDDAQALELSGHPVAIVTGDEYLIKITTPLDQIFAGALYQNFVEER